ncbi:MAG TPA: SpoIIE family protein phosphatase [Saprospiraceae bacterium]|nr:SpoIIE family protein phosphatase [Saprospiraceae bacterium]HMX81725.1 SpoIIE family protein phosphatase [Saprospiraceae bacterium]HMZ72672.1 SpoIIE family protein phosphatase [Saprospiraceae bacterium]HNA40743.1 SpoIIE family protein phosphatase [Saprospiraceae bacterium]HND15807.1 SpoIIE family protein phosphatase [Saprospiraceae bacterium]
MSPLESKVKEKNEISDLEHKLSLKQLQLNGLMSITQAINDNVKEQGLFQMYSDFINWQLGVKKMALFIQKDKEWVCATSIGAGDTVIDESLTHELHKYERLNHLDNETHPGLMQFDVIIPVQHKNSPIAYVLIGNIENQDDSYGKVLFITTITNIIAVAIENKRLFKKQIQQERLNREMELASDVQHMLIPSKLPGNNYFNLSSYYLPHIGVGGDYYDCISLSEESLIICIADISGKGLAAAMLMSNFQATLHVLLSKDTELLSLVKELNKSVYNIAKGDRYITFFIAKIEATKKTIEYINCGHVPPIANINGMILELDKGSTILGGFEELPFIEKGELSYKEVCTVLCYTDGITDILNNEGEYFSDALVHDLFRHSNNLTPDGLVEKIKTKIHEFKQEQEYTDDMTVLVCKSY